MPIIPQWLKPADEAANYLHGVAIGQQAAEANARLDEARNRVAMESQIHQDTLKQRALEDSQRIAVTKQYHEQEIGLRQQQLQEIAAQNAAKTRAAAMKLQQQARFNQTYQATGDVQKALFDSGLGTPQNVLAARKDAQDLGDQRLNLSRERLSMQEEALKQRTSKAVAPRRIGERTVTDPVSGDKTTKYMYEGQGGKKAADNRKRFRYDPTKGELLPVGAPQEEDLTPDGETNQ